MPLSQSSALSYSKRAKSAQKRTRPLSANSSAANTRPSSSHRMAHNSTRNTNDFQVRGSALSLQATPNTASKKQLLSNYVSVKELCSGTANLTQQLKMDDSTYIVPQYSWKKPKFNEARQKKLDYICLFAEKVHPEVGELTKIHHKKKHEVPGPQAYDMVKNWSKKSAHDYEQQRGRQYRQDRLTSTEALIKSVKAEKLPAPNAYKPRRQSRILGPANSKSHQMAMIANAQWYAKQTPGHSYKPSVTLTKPSAPSYLYYPRTKVEGSGPGLKAIKKDSDLAPGYYKINRKLTERSSSQFKFAGTPNRNYVDRYIKSKQFVPGVGKYKDLDKGLALQTRPLSCGGRRRIS